MPRDWVLSFKLKYLKKKTITISDNHLKIQILNKLNKI